VTAFSSNLLVPAGFSAERLLDGARGAEHGRRLRPSIGLSLEDVELNEAVLRIEGDSAWLGIHYDAHAAVVVRHADCESEPEAEKLPPEAPPTGGGVDREAREAEHCDGPLPLRSLIRVGQSMLAELTAEELDAIWRSLHAGRCERQLLAADREWLGLLEAIGQRDRRRMAAASRQVLSDHPGLDPPLRRYLVAAGMLGSITQGDLAAARELWSAHERSIDIANDLLLQVLVSRSREE